MKTIIETSLEFSGVSVNARTLFDADNMSKKPIYYNLSRKSGQPIRVWYDVEENGQVQTLSKKMDIPADLDEQGVKDFIFTNISE